MTAYWSCSESLRFLEQNAHVMKALIPIAGKGTRMRPITSLIPKALMPLVDRTGQLKTVLQVILEGVKQVGIEESAIIVSPGQQVTVERYFEEVRSRDSNSLPGNVEYIEQPTPQGFGDAVYQGKAFVGNDSFVLLLGDFIHINEIGEKSCIQQVKEAYESNDARAMIGMQIITEDVLSLVGVATGVPISQNTYRATRFIEKPTIEQAREQLVCNHLGSNRYLGHCGIYVFDPSIFDYIEKAAEEAAQNRTETELARAQSLVLEENSQSYYLRSIKGKSYDTGTPKMYANAFEVYRKGKL